MNKLWIALIALLIVPSVLAWDLSVTSPEATTYNETDILLEGETGNTSTDVSYALDGENETLVCENCTSFSETITGLEEGNHSIAITVTGQNETKTAVIEFSIVLPIPELELTVVEPEEETYDDTEIPLEVETNLNALIRHQLDDGNVTVACEDCTSFEGGIEDVEEGNHTLTFFAETEDQNATGTVTFEVVLEDELEITIEEPEDTVYNDRDIPVHITTNRLVDIYYRLDDQDDVLACEDCSGFQTTLENVSDGVHEFFASAEDMTESIDFGVDTEEPDATNETHDGEQRFSLGYNKLPPALEDGAISDEQLLDILEEERLNPGILNRLAKTGLLTEEHIDAIIENQFVPSGIANKFFGWLLPDNDDVAKSLFKKYSLSEEQQAALLSQSSDFRPGTVKRIAKNHRLKSKAIASVIESWEDEDVLETLAEEQTLEAEELDELLKKARKEKTVRKVVRNQVLNDDQQEMIAAAHGKDPGIKEELEKLDKVPPGLAKKENKVTGKAVARGKRN